MHLRTIVSVVTLAFLVSACISGNVGVPQQPDDVVRTQDGYAYRESAFGNGVSIGSMTISEHTVVFVVDGRTLQLTYRNVIETVAGATRNCIVTLRLVSDVATQRTSTRLSLRLSVVAGSVGLTLAPGEPNWGPDPRSLVQVPMRIHVASSAKPGEYPVTLAAKVDGVLVGELPCEITVVAGARIQSSSLH